MTVHVVNTVPESINTRARIPYASFVSAKKTEQTMVGIDVSRFQGEIDFEKVREAGCEFVIMRIGGYDDGAVYVDRYYEQNLQNARAAGLKIGIYYHAEERTATEVRRHVQWLLKVLDGEPLDFPIAYDWEDYTHFEDYGINFSDLNQLYEAFDAALNEAGYETMLYGSKSYLESIWAPSAATHTVWLAHYTSSTSYAGKYILWQRDNVGQIPGVEGDVDLDVYYP